MYGRRKLQVVLWDPADLQAAELHPAVFTSGGTTASGRFYRCPVKLQHHRFVVFAAIGLHFPPCFVPYLESLPSIGLQTIGVPKVLRFSLGQNPFQNGKILGRGKRYASNVLFFTIGDFLIFYPDKGLYVRAGGTIKLYFVPIYLRADKHSQLAAGTLLGKVIVGRKFKAVFRKL